MEFYLNFTLPSSTFKAKIKELSFKQLRSLNKFISNKDEISISSAFETILNENIHNFNELPPLNNLEKFCILFLIRMASISPEIEFKKDLILRKLSLSTLFNILTNKKFTFFKKIEKDNIELKLSLPKSLYFNELFNNFYECLDEIKINNDKIIKVNNLTQEEQLTLYENLPAHVLNELKDHKIFIENQFAGIEFKIDEENKIEITPFNHSLFELLKLIYSIDLKTLYDLHFLIVTKLNYTPDYVDSNTLLENIILINNYNDEIAKAAEESKKSALDAKNPLNK